MTKTVFITLLSLVISLTACQNNGDIGDYFGTWAVSEMTVDGTPAPDFTPDITFFSFQNNIVFVERLVDTYDDLERYAGTWVDTGDVLRLNFTHSDDAHQPGQGVYHAPDWLYFPENSVIDLKFLEKKSRSMTLQYTTDEGATIVYTLKKTW